MAPETGLKTTRARGHAKTDRSRSCLEGTRGTRALFLCLLQSARLDAKTNRHFHHPDHRRWPDRDRPGLRVRLFGHAGGQGAEGRGLPRRPRQFQSGHDHDRSGAGGRDLYRADHAGNRRQDHRAGTPCRSRRLRAAADHGRADRAELRAVAAASGHAGEIRRRDDRRHGGCHRQGGGPPAVPQRHDQDRPADAEIPARQRLGAEEVVSRQTPGRARKTLRAPRWKSWNGNGRSARTTAASATRNTRSARR